MSTRTRPRPLRMTSLPALVLLAVGTPAALGDLRTRPTAERVAQRDDESRAPLVLEGRVLARDGAPAPGAVVVSSAGGRALTDADGNYRLEVAVPLDAWSVQVSAVGPRNLHASTTVGLSTAPASTQVGPLFLGQSPFCAEWLPTFGQAPGTDGAVLALTVFDDGSGSALYVAGQFSDAGGSRVNCVAKWDGSRWSKLGEGILGSVRTLAVFDDGSGPALYVGGQFPSAGDAAANGVARWDGTSWSELGGGVNDTVAALAVFDDGGGNALYAGGTFTSAGGNAVKHIAKWDGSGWTDVGGGVVGSVSTLLACDLGGGPELVVGGAFEIEGTHAHNIASWNGSSWSVLAGGLSAAVQTVAQWDDGAGSALYAGGSFLRAGDLTVNHVARWDGSGWSDLDGGVDTLANVDDFAVFDDGSGPTLIVGGDFTTAGGVSVSHIARWDGASWSAYPGMDDAVFALAVYDAGDGPALYAGGAFTHSDGKLTNHVARSAGGSWEPMGKGLTGAVDTLADWDDGGGEALFVGGRFDSVDGVAANGVASWDGARWSALAGGTNGSVYALARFDDGGGSALYAAGDFSVAGGASANRVARWDGTSWSELGRGVSGGAGVPVVRALAVFDAGDGPALYAGGSFSSAGGSSASGIARWDGTSWSTLGGGVTAGASGDPVVYALAIFDDGTGPALYVGGAFTSAGGVFAGRIARWDGASWSALGSGVSGIGNRVLALAVYDDGSGPALYAGGSFDRVGGVPASGIAKWDGAGWSALGSGVNGSVAALTMHDDGSGPALYAGGGFTTAGALAANRIARWDGASWSALDGGCTGSVNALLSFVGAAALYVGGEFQKNVDSGDSYLAVWACDTTPPVLTHPSAVFALDRIGSAPGEVVTFTVTATDDEDPAPSVVCVPASGSTFPLGTTMVSCTATDASGNSSHGEFPVVVRTPFQQHQR